MVFSPSAGVDEALGPFVFRIINILSICQFLFYLFPLNDMLTVFPIQMHWQSMLTLSSNRSRSPQVHDLYIHCSTLAINASCQVSLKSIHRFWRRFLKGFYHIWAWRPFWSCDLDNIYVYCPRVGVYELLGTNLFQNH